MPTGGLLHHSDGNLVVQAQGFAGFNFPGLPVLSVINGFRVGGEGKVNDCCLSLWIQALDCITLAPTGKWFEVTKTGAVIATVGGVTAEYTFAQLQYFTIDGGDGRTKTLRPGVLRCDHGELAGDITIVTSCDECVNCGGDSEAEPPYSATPTPRRIRVRFDVSGIKQKIGKYREEFLDYPMWYMEGTDWAEKLNRVEGFCLCWGGECIWSTTVKINDSTFTEDPANVFGGPYTSSQQTYLTVSAERTLPNQWRVSASLTFSTGIGTLYTIGDYGVALYQGYVDENTCSEGVDLLPIFTSEWSDFKWLEDYAAESSSFTFPHTTYVAQGTIAGFPPGPYLMDEHTFVVSRDGEARLQPLPDDLECPEPRQCCLDCCNQLDVVFWDDEPPSSHSHIWYARMRSTKGKNGNCYWEMTSSTGIASGYIQTDIEIDGGDGSQWLGTFTGTAPMSDPNVISAIRGDVCPPTGPDDWDFVDNPDALELLFIAETDCLEDAGAGLCDTIYFTFSSIIGADNPITNTFTRITVGTESVGKRYENGHGDFITFANGLWWLVMFEGSLTGSSQPTIWYSSPTGPNGGPAITSGAWSVHRSAGSGPLVIDSVSIPSGCP